MSAKTKLPSASQQALKTIIVPKDKPPVETPLSTCHKVSFSLFDPDMAALDQLIDRLWQDCSVRASRSDAAKLAVRFAAAKMDTAALKAGYRDIKSEDRRR
jgi:lysozyme family protein